MILIRASTCTGHFGSFSPLFLSQSNVYIGLGATEEEVKKKTYVVISKWNFIKGTFEITSNQCDSLCETFETRNKSAFLKNDSKPKVDNVTLSLHSH